MITEAYLRVCYLALGLLAFACALTTTLLMSTGQSDAMIRAFSLGSLWIAAVIVACLVVWATLATRKRPAMAAVAAEVLTS